MNWPISERKCHFTKIYPVKTTTSDWPETLGISATQGKLKKICINFSSVVKWCFLCIIDVLFRVIIPQLNTRESEEIETVMQTRDTVKGFHNLF